VTIRVVKRVYLLRSSGTMTHSTAAGREAASPQADVVPARCSRVTPIVAP